MKTIPTRSITTAMIVVTSALAICPSIVLARPSEAPEMSAKRLEAAPLLDGSVRGDDAWSGAIPATGFWQTRPSNGNPASQQTEVFVGYDDEALYIGVIAYDENPTEIIVTDSRRDSDLGDTDAFIVVIDGLLDRQNGYVFGTDPGGVEFDGQVTAEGAGTGAGFEGGAVNLNWDGSWRVATASGDYGWSAEFEIPFRTLRFSSAEVQDWGINFQRNIRRNNEVAYWSPLDRNRNLYRVSEAGTLRGVSPPVQRNLKVVPYVLGSAERGGLLSGTETDAEAGIDVKYLVTPSLTLDLTLNTDFAQVEADDQQINLDRFNLFFPEKRAFFLENAGLFAVGNPGLSEIFFSRRIGISDDGDVIPVEGGARLSGKIGDTTNVGFLIMETEGLAGIESKNRYTVARVSEELPNRSAIGAMIVNRDGNGSAGIPSANDHNTAYAVDGRWGIGEHIMLDGWLAKTETPGRTGKDHAFGFNATYNSEEWINRLEYSELREDFNPEVGFLQRDDYRRVSALVFRRKRFDESSNLLEIRPHVSYTGFWKFDGFHESGFLHLDNHFEYRSGMEIHTGVNFRKAGVIDAFEIVDGVVIQPGTYNHEELQLVYFTNRSKPWHFGLNAVIGGRFGGDRVALNPSLVYRQGDTFRGELEISYNDFDLPVPGGDFTANLARLRLSYAFTPKVLLQALVQYNEVADIVGTNLRFSWLQSANSGLFVVYNEVDEREFGAPPTGRQFIIKYSYIFDLLD